MAEITFDANKLANNVEIKITRVSIFKWRLSLSLFLLRMAQRVAPFNIEISEQLGQPWLFYCQFCSKDFTGFFVPGWKAFSVHCYHCNRQNLASSDSDKAWTIAEKDMPPCEYDCEFIDPYGFVPEADCPVHDRY